MRYRDEIRLNNPPPYKNIILPNEMFGNLKTIEYFRNKKNKMGWKCICQCGNYTFASSTQLNSGLKRSCGCLISITARNLMTKHGCAIYGSVSIEFAAWSSMKARCLKADHKAYKDYGGRGIKVCDRWLNSFQNFLEDMGKKPTPKLSLDRIDVNGNYEPSNCRWATHSEQRRNLRKNRYLEYKGRKMILADWAKELNCLDSRIYYQLNKGKDFEFIYDLLKNKIINHE